MSQKEHKELNKDKFKAPQVGKTSPCNSIGWAVKPLGVLLCTGAEYGPIGCPETNVVNSNLDCMKIAQPRDPGKGIFSTAQYLLSHRHSDEFGGLHYKDDTGKCSVQATKMLEAGALVL